MKKLKPSEFEEILGVEVIDPDGWNRKDPDDYEKPITIYEFMNKLGPSTVKYSKEFIQMFVSPNP